MKLKMKPKPIELVYNFLQKVGDPNDPHHMDALDLLVRSVFFINAKEKELETKREKEKNLSSNYEIREEIQGDKKVQILVEKTTNRTIN